MWRLGVAALCVVLLVVVQMSQCELVDEHRSYRAQLAEAAVLNAECSGALAERVDVQRQLDQAASNLADVCLVFAQRDVTLPKPWWIKPPKDDPALLACFDVDAQGRLAVTPSRP